MERCPSLLIAVLDELSVLLDHAQTKENIIFLELIEEKFALGLLEWQLFIMYYFRLLLNHLELLDLSRLGLLMRPILPISFFQILEAFPQIFGGHIGQDLTYNAEGLQFLHFFP